jgi:hypothetical protein
MMTKEKMLAAWRPIIRRSVLDYKRLAPEVRKEVSRIARRGACWRPSPEDEAWLNRVPGYPFHREVYAAIRSLEGREFPYLAINNKGPASGPQEISL